MSHLNQLSFLVATAVASTTAAIVARNHSRSQLIRNTGQLGFVDVEKIGWCAMRENLCRVCVLTSRVICHVSRCSKQCKCLDPKNQAGANCKGTCKYKSYKGDGNCDDENK